MTRPSARQIAANGAAYTAKGKMDQPQAALQLVR
jgi:hypothetical protein